MSEEYYGQATANNEQKTVQERCREYYAIGDTVVVINIDTEPFVYQIQRPENQSFDQPDPVHMNVTNVRPPIRVVLQPGETHMCPAYEADLMIKALMDKMVYRNRSKVISESGTPKESVSDPDTQRRYISEIFQGKRDFISEYNESLKKPDVSKDLEDEPEETNQPAATAKSTAKR